MLDDHPLKIHITTSRIRQLATRLLALDMVQAVALNGATELMLEVRHAKQFFGALADVVTQDGFDIERLQVSDASTEAVFDYLMESANHPR